MESIQANSRSTNHCHHSKWNLCNSNLRKIKNELTRLFSFRSDCHIPDDIAKMLWFESIQSVPWIPIQTIESNRMCAMPIEPLHIDVWPKRGHLSGKNHEREI